LYDKVSKYLSKHPMYNATIHAAGGIAVGILIARPMDGGHPLKLALVFGGIAIFGHLYPILIGKK
jgi:hypothetical protein